MALSSIDATRVQVPAYTVVTLRPSTVHTSVVDDESVTVWPEVAVGVNPSGAVSNARSDGCANVMVWAILATVMVMVFDVASR